MQSFKSALIIEFIGTVVGIFCCWLFTSVFNWGIYGAVININLFNFLNLVNYLLYLKYGKEFEDFRNYVYKKQTKINSIDFEEMDKKLLKNKDNVNEDSLFDIHSNTTQHDYKDKEDIDNVKIGEINVLINQEVQANENEDGKTKINEKDSEKLLTWKGYFIFCLPFLFLVFSEGLWFNLDTVFVSMIFEKAQITAQVSMFNV